MKWLIFALSLFCTALHAQVVRGDSCELSLVTTNVIDHSVLMYLDKVPKTNITLFVKGLEARARISVKKDTAFVYYYANFVQDSCIAKYVDFINATNDFHTIKYIGNNTYEVSGISDAQYLFYWLCFNEGLR